jgi:hypothetical protein
MQLHQIPPQFLGSDLDGSGPLVETGVFDAKDGIGLLGLVERGGSVFKRRGQAGDVIGLPCRVVPAPSPAAQLPRSLSDFPTLV